VIHRPGLVLLAGMLCGAGCAKQQDAAQIREAESAYLRALATEQSGDHAAARELYRQASQRGGLQVDEFVECQIRLSLCEARLGDFGTAHQLLDSLAEGAPDMGRIHAARAFVFRRQQRPGEASAEEQRARQINPKIALIKE